MLYYSQSATITAGFLSFLNINAEFVIESRIRIGIRRFAKAIPKS